jgi:uncharacterized protein YndB with AHSA1/START domain
MSDTIEREITIAAPVERVWELITRPEHVGRWFGDAGAEIDLRPGGALSLTWEEFGTVTGTVERVEPTTVFAYRWKLADVGETRVQFTLSDTGDGTRLHVIESGFESLARDQKHHLDDHTEGWGIELGHLDEYTRARV